MEVTILRPTAAEECYHVVPADPGAGSCPGSGADSRGYICARVRARDAKFQFPPPATSAVGGVPRAAGDADHVFARVYDGHVDENTLGVPWYHPDPLADPCTRRGNWEGNFTWHFPQLFGTLHGPAPGVLSTLVVWAVFPGGTGPVEVRRFSRFYGWTAGQVECELGGGSGCGSESVAGGGGIVAAVGLTLAPLLWNVTAAGFAAGKALFNGPWALALRGTPNGHCTWDNGGDGEKIPRVELTCESPVVTTWRLALRHGADVVEYTRDAGEWNPVGANDLRRTACAAGTAPDRLTLTPG